LSDESFVTDPWFTEDYVAKAERKFQQTPQGHWTTARAIYESKVRNYTGTMLENNRALAKAVEDIGEARMDAMTTIQPIENIIENIELLLFSQTNDR
jgi:hypothetical protein